MQFKNGRTKVNQDTNISTKTWAALLCWPLTALTGALTLALLVLWLANVCSIFDTVGRHLGIAAASSSIEVQAGVWQERILGWFPDVAAKMLLFVLETDLSSVSALLIFFFSYCFFRGCLAVVRKNYASMMAPEFPFPRRFRITLVQFGLLGTLAAFLALGAQLENLAMDMQESATVLILVTAFGTALLSTFVSIFLVYVVAPAIQSFFQCCVTLPLSRNAEENSVALFFQGLEQATLALARISETLKPSTEGIRHELERMTESVTSASTAINAAFADAAGPLQTHMGSVSELLVDSTTATKAATSEFLELHGQTQESIGLLTNAVASLAIELRGQQKRAHEDSVALADVMKESCRANTERHSKIWKCIIQLRDELRRKPRERAIIRHSGGARGSDITGGLNNLIERISNITKFKKPGPNGGRNR